MSELQAQDPSNTHAAPTAVPKDRTLAIVVHVLGLFTGFLGSLIIYLMKKDTDDTFTADHAREALNFHINLILWSLLSLILTIVIIGVFMLMAVSLVLLIGAIMGAVKAHSGEQIRFPFIIRFLK